MVGNKNAKNAWKLVRYQFFLSMIGPDAPFMVLESHFTMIYKIVQGILKFSIFGKS